MRNCSNHRFLAFVNAFRHWNIPLSGRLFHSGQQINVLNALCLTQWQWVEQGHACVGLCKRMKQLLGRKAGRWVTWEGTAQSPQPGWIKLPLETLPCTRKAGVIHGCSGHPSRYWVVVLLLFQAEAEICHNIPRVFWCCLALNMLECNAHYTCCLLQL